MDMSLEEDHRPGHDDVDGKIFIGGLSWQTTEASLRFYFEKYGELTDVALMVDKRSGQPRYDLTIGCVTVSVYVVILRRGFGFITMKDPKAVDLIVSTEHTIDGRVVDVKRAVPRDMAPAPSRSESKKIFVGGLPAEVTETEFTEYFSQFGEVKVRMNLRLRS
jgi:RNA-binding protein Musashi